MRDLGCGVRSFGRDCGVGSSVPALPLGRRGECAAAAHRIARLTVLSWTPKWRAIARILVAGGVRGGHGNGPGAGGAREAWQRAGSGQALLAGDVDQRVGRGHLALKRGDERVVAEVDLPLQIVPDRSRPCGDEGGIGALRRPAPLAKRTRAASWHQSGLHETSMRHFCPPARCKGDHAASSAACADDLSARVSLRQPLQ